MVSELPYPEKFFQKKSFRIWMTRIWYPAMIRAIHVSLAKYDFSLVPGHLNKPEKERGALRE